MAQIFNLGWDEGGGVEVERSLRVWEEELVVECRLLLLYVVLHIDVDDVWIWIRDPMVGYLVREAYHTLIDGSQSIPTGSAASTTFLWRKEVPLKVSIFDWHLFRNRLSTRVDLFWRGIIQQDAQLCVTGFGLLESDDHLFLLCGVFGQVWQVVRLWLGVHSAEPSTIVDHFTQFVTSSFLAKSRCSFINLIWFASSWVIDKERNARIFRAKEATPYQLVENIKLLFILCLGAG